MPSGGGTPEIKSVKSGGCSGPLITEAEGALGFLITGRGWRAEWLTAAEPGPRRDRARLAAAEPGSRRGRTRLVAAGPGKKCARLD